MARLKTIFASLPHFAGLVIVLALPLDGCGDGGGGNGDATDRGSDAGCACSTITDAIGERGNLPLACYCATGACPDYATALSSCNGLDNHLDVYPACNLEVISLPTNSFELGAQVFYDATTHALVGASYTSDTPSHECGSQMVRRLGGGTSPPDDCARGERKWLCRGDAGQYGSLR